MNEPRLVLCGGASAGKKSSDARPLLLNLQGAAPNVSLKITDISKAIAQNIPNVLLDLLEVAVYVYSADQAIGRGGITDTGRRWRRDFQFHIPVREPDLWSYPEVSGTLVDVLSFLSDDDYGFVFSKLVDPPPFQLYFDSMAPEFTADEVALFSGGLDSLAGAIQEVLIDQREVALISHTSASKRKPRIAALAADVAARAERGALHHIPVSATKAESIGHEYTQRSRSFLYAALAATVTSVLGHNRIRFYENGVTSINLPIAPQVVGGRATRTTHPQSIGGFARLLSTLFARPFAVEAPFLWKTKTDVARLIKDHGCGDLVARSVSCSKTVEATRLHTHCGRCSQCIDRRFATLAAGLDEEEDPPEMYKVDLLTGERTIGENRAMAESFLQRASRLRSGSDIEFFAQYPEVTRVLRRVGLTSDEAGQRIWDLHRRHGEDVFAALAEGHKRFAVEFQQGRLPDSCLLVLAVPGRYRQGGPDALPTVPTFRLEGEFWKIAFEQEQISLKDKVGLRHLARLLASPGQEVHSALLLAQEAGQPGLVQSGSAGEASDSLSLRAYRARLELLGEEFAEAARAGDVERQMELREEGEQLTQLLKQVTDIRGNSRKAADDDEKARQAVSVAIRRAMKVISRKHTPLWRHLNKHLKPGVFCSYAPDPPLTWITN